MWVQGLASCLIHDFLPGECMKGPSQPFFFDDPTVFEDDDIMVVNKSVGISTQDATDIEDDLLWRLEQHKGMSLTQHHRLDQETSGLVLFSKSDKGRALFSKAFETQGAIRKIYLAEMKLVSGKPWEIHQTERWEDHLFHTKGKTIQVKREHPGAQHAVLMATLLSKKGNTGIFRIELVTGRTHQIRAQASIRGMPIVGDMLYGGSESTRMMLHAHEIVLGGRKFVAPHDGTFDGVISFARCLEYAYHRRLRLFRDPTLTGFRWVNQEGDGIDGVVIDVLGHIGYVQFYQEGMHKYLPEIEVVASHIGLKDLVMIQRPKSSRGTPPPIQHCALKGGMSGGQWIGMQQPLECDILEHGIHYKCVVGEGISTGLFFDQRSTRAKLRAEVQPEQTVLNLFSYTCGFSVVAAIVGAKTVSVDVSQKNLDWGKENFRLNGVDPEAHKFVKDDAIAFLKRLQKKGAQFDHVVIDPPTFSSHKEGHFRSDKDWEALAFLASQVIKVGGLMWVSSNDQRMSASEFLKRLPSSWTWKPITVSPDCRYLAPKIFQGKRSRKAAS